jgi:hypothetical protein
MTPPQDFFAEYPEQVRGRTLKPSAVYELKRDGYALHRGPTGMYDDQAITIVEGKPGDREIKTGNVGPLYALKPAGTPAVPTGLVFIRFAAGVKAADRTEDLERAGYEIARTVEYSPAAAWVRSASDNIAQALNGIPALEKIKGVENVEPQMLMARASR